MVHHLNGLSGRSIQPEEIGGLLIQCFIVVQECFRETAEQWDELATGPVCRRKFHLHLC